MKKVKKPVRTVAYGSLAIAKSRLGEWFYSNRHCNPGEKPERLRFFSKAWARNKAGSWHAMNPTEEVQLCRN
jgi:hypothetical protein